ncbi:MAG: universal stress protein [Phaeodactylibacter sp.]|nr:universal stress protein [Phaeodactylibacter sp.]
MPTTSEKTTAKDKALQPFTIGKAVVGLGLDRADEPLLQYLNFLSGPIPMEGLSFIHVIPNTRKRLPLVIAPGVEVKREDEEEAIRALKERVQQALPAEAAGNMEYFIDDGSPLEKLLALVKEKEAGLLVLGRKADAYNHGVLSKNIIRQTKADVLVIPEKAKTELKTILVPIDFSDNSVRALKTALSIKKQIGEGVKIYAINIYQRPNLMAYKLNMTPERFEQNIQENHEKGFEKFMNEELPGYLDEIEPILIWRDMPDVAHQIMNKAREIDANLVVIGCKGHSKLELMLLGSTTETLLNIDTSIPALVVS